MSYNNNNFYQNSFELIKDELLRLDFLIQLRLLKFHDNSFSSSSSSSASANVNTSLDTVESYLKGFMITDEEVKSLLNCKSFDSNQSSGRSFTEDGDDAESLRLKQSIKRIEQQIANKTLVTQEKRVFLSLPYLLHIFNLTEFEKDVIIICLAQEIDSKYGRIYAYLNDDITQKKASISLIFALTCSSAEDNIRARYLLSEQSRMLKFNILYIGDNEASQGQYTKPFVNRTVKLDDGIVDFLLGIYQSNRTIESFAKLVDLNVSDKQVNNYGGLNHYHTQVLINNLESFIPEYLITKQNSKQKIILNFFGAISSGRKTTAKMLCRNLGMPYLLIIDLYELATKHLPHLEDYLILCFREALLRGATAIYFDNFEFLLDQEEKSYYYPTIKMLVKLIEEQYSLPLVFLGSLRSWNAVNFFNENCLFMNIEHPTPGYVSRKLMWNSIARNCAKTGIEFAKDVELDALASKFIFVPGKIHSAFIFAKNLAIARDPKNISITMDDLYLGCRRQSANTLSGISKKLEPIYSWDDIILPSHTVNLLKQISNHVRYKGTVYYDWGFDKKFSMGKGVIALFSGESGTGKSMAGEIIANDLKLEIYKIDLSSVVSKYIGETEKKLSTIFREAEDSNSILFFDEADALFGKRSEVKDSHDRYANIETNYLLQKMDEYEGVVILATNFKKNIDDAFIRRIHLIIDFPFPDAQNRLKIWKSSFPREAPLNNDIDFNLLADKLQISGGNIKNIVVNSAFIAAYDLKPISMKHIVDATKLEFEKIGKPIYPSDFGEYSNLFITS